MSLKNIFALLLVVFSGFSISAVTYSPLVEVAPGGGLPENVECMDSNNNLDIVRFDGRLFFGFRTAPTHFAGKKTMLYIVSSTDEGKTWDYEAKVFMKSDMREPRFLEVNGKLMFYYFQAGTNMLAFSPKDVYAMERNGLGDWTKPVKIFKPGCVLWRAKEIEGEIFATVYCGGDELYTGGSEGVGIYFLTTDDGYEFRPINPDRPVSATGGSETAFEMDTDKTMYLAIRNEGGDGDSWGSKVCKAGPEDYSDWDCVETPFKYDSSIMFRQGDDIYLISRRNIDGEYDKNTRILWNPAETLYYMARYWWTPKRTALYKLDKQNLKFDPVLDFPSKGDTAFPGLVRIDENSLLFYNYSSPIEGKDRVWMMGQLTGTKIYSTILTFEEE